MANDPTYLEIPIREDQHIKRPRARFKRALFSIGIVFSILLTIYFATPLSRLGVIQFDGLESLNRSELITLIDLADDERFLRINLRELQTSIEEHPAVQYASVSRIGINRLLISVVEYEVGACAIVDNQLVYILSDGTLIHENEGIQASCNDRIIHGLTESELEAEIASLFVSQLMLVDSSVLSLIRSIEHSPLYGDVHRFVLFLADGNVVNVSSYNMVYRLNLLPQFLAWIPEGTTGVLHLDVGLFFSSEQNGDGENHTMPLDEAPPY